MSVYKFTEKGIEYPLYEWQNEALHLWCKDNKGIISAVTGSGKTRVACAVISKWFSDNPNGSVSVIVPNIALLDQWKDTLAPIFYDRNIGLMGGGHQEWYGTLNILVVDTAVKVLGGRTGGLGTAHLIIADECHTMGADTHREVFDCSHHATLGLSATPEREDTGLDVIAPLLGDIIMRYTYEDALKDGVIPPFTLKAVKVDLIPSERKKYDDYQFRITNLTKKLGRKYGSSGNLISRCQYLLSQGVKDPDIGGLLNSIREQKELLNSARNRFAVLDILLHRHLTKNHQKTMLFHESVPDIQDMAKRYKHLNPLEYHYKVTTSRKKRNAILDKFKNGDSNFLMSCRSLSEGFNSPKAEVGIMLSGTRSVRSRIQTLGRLLRGDQAIVYFIYVANTKDTRSLSNLLNKGGVPQENVEHWEYTKAKGTIEPASDSKSIAESLTAEYEVQAKWAKTKSEFGKGAPLTCEHCGRGMDGGQSRPFRTKNGQETHKVGCRDAQRGIFRCVKCRKAFISEEKRELHKGSKDCKDITEMSFDEFMGGFNYRHNLE